jgi:hypothetical protein
LFTNGIEAKEVEGQVALSGDQRLARNVLKVISIIA